MTHVVKPGNIIAYLTGKAKASTAEAWVRDLDKVWDAMTEVTFNQKGFLAMKALWNLDNSRNILVLAFWNSLPERLAYEKAAAGGVRANMETTLVGPPPRPKYEVVRAMGAPLEGIKVGHVAAILSAKARATTVADYSRELDRVWSGATDILTKRPGNIGAHVLYSIEGTREVHSIGYWASLADRIAYENSVSRQVQGRFEQTLEPPYPRPRYIIVKTT